MMRLHGAEVEDTFAEAFGMWGARILVTLIHEMIRRDAKKGLASLCIGGGMGIAMAIENLELGIRN